MQWPRVDDAFCGGGCDAVRDLDFFFQKSKNFTKITNYVEDYMYTYCTRTVLYTYT